MPYQWNIVYHDDYTGPAWPSEVNAGKIVHGPSPGPPPGDTLVKDGHIGIFNPPNNMGRGTSLNGTATGTVEHRDAGASYESVAAHSVDGTTTGVFCAETKWVTQHVGCNWAGNHYSVVFIGELAYMIGGPPGYETLDPTNLTFGPESYYYADWVYCFNTQGYQRGVGGLSYMWGAGGGGYAPVWLRLVWNTSPVSASLIPLGISATLPPGKFVSIYSHDGITWFTYGGQYNLPAFFTAPTCFGVSSMWRSEWPGVVYFEFEYLRLWQYSVQGTIADVPGSMTADMLWADATIIGTKDKHNMLSVGTPYALRTPVAFGQGGAQGVDNALWDTLHGFMWDDDMSWS